MPLAAVPAQRQFVPRFEVSRGVLAPDKESLTSDRGEDAPGYRSEVGE
jgi:hypothetical protein